ncbi:MAG: hypothetical protein KAT90_15230, partial [Gammaproteobacteria bacterium]|nr:hypothetical protein [Gammaproteobacteria bacterium]
MSDKPKLYIAGMGMITPVGANTEMTAAAVKSGMSTYKESDYFDEDNNKITMSVIPQELLDESLVEEKIIGKISPRHARMLQLSKLALMQINTIPNDIKIPLFLAGPETVNVSDPQLKKKFIENVCSQCEVELDVDSSRIVSTGRAGGLDVIDLAIRYLEVAPVDYVLVGAVDTFHEKDVMEYYMKNGRIQTNSTMDGFVPGEGAAFLLLSKKPSPNDAEVWPFIIEPGIDQEEGHLFSDETYTGSGLATAATKALSQSGITSINTIYSSMNGEHYFAKELGVMIIRNKKAFDDYELLHPADCYGDLGAAAGIVMIGMACISLSEKQDTSPYLICCSSDSASRSAAIVS